MSAFATKACTKCGEVKPVDEFSKAKREKDGRQSHCKACFRAYYRANSERIIEQKQSYRQANREQLNERGRALYRANRERYAARKRAYYYESAERRRAYRRANRERIAEQHRAWVKANPDKKKMADHRRRAKKKCAVPQRWIVDHSLGDPLACWWCGRGLLGAKPEIEHVMPIELKGPTVPSNLVKACRTCNRRKTEKHPLVWLAEITSC